MSTNGDVYWNICWPCLYPLVTNDIPFSLHKVFVHYKIKHSKGVSTLAFQKSLKQSLNSQKQNSKIPFYLATTNSCVQLYLWQYNFVILKLLPYLTWAFQLHKASQKLICNAWLKCHYMIKFFLFKARVRFMNFYKRVVLFNTDLWLHLRISTILIVRLIDFLNICCVGMLDQLYPY